jgi:integron integrase
MSQLLDRVREVVRTHHYSIRTEEAYVHWIRQFILFHGKRHPDGMSREQIEQFLTHLAVDRGVATSTQNQARSALLFLYREILDRPLERLGEVTLAKRPERLPTVLTREEVRAVLAQLDGTSWLMASLLYGAGLRLLECLRLRIKDVDFGQKHLVVRDGKGRKDRVTLLPEALVEPLRRQIERARERHARDLAEGYGRVYLPDALVRKYPEAERALPWQFVFPAHERSVDPRSGAVRRHHQHERALQRAVHEAVRRAGLSKPAGCHTLRHNADCRIMPTGVSRVTQDPADRARSSLPDAA